MLTCSAYRMPKFEKTVVSSGSDSVPCEHDRVVIQVSLLIGGVVKLNEQIITFDLGFAEDFGVITVLDAIVGSMRLKEKCIVKSTTLSGLTDFERDQLNLTHSEDFEMLFNVELQDIQKLNKFWQMSEHEKVSVAKVMKCRGNKLTQVSQYVRAFRAYKLGISFLQGSVCVLIQNNASKTEPDGELVREARQTLSLCFSNGALCLLRLATSANEDIKDTESTRRVLHKCIDYCMNSIELEPTYAKSWYRLSKAQAMLGDFDAAVRAGQRCLEIIQNDEDNPLLSEVTNLLQHWNMQAFKAKKEEQSIIRKAVLKKYKYTDEESDEEDEIDKLPISVWSNSLAADMMSLHEELEAFGEKMPEPRVSRSGRRLETIIDDDLSDEAEGG